MLLLEVFLSFNPMSICPPVTIEGPRASPKTQVAVLCSHLTPFSGVTSFVPTAVPNSILALTAFLNFGPIF